MKLPLTTAIVFAGVAGILYWQFGMKENQVPSQGSASLVGAVPEDPAPNHKPKYSSASLPNKAIAEPKVQVQSTLAIEREFLVEANDISFLSPSVVSILSSDQFEQRLGEFHRQQSGDTYSSEMTANYVDLLNEFKDSSDDLDFELEDISCGYRMCIGRLSTPDSATTWSKLVMQHLGQGSGASFGSLVNYPIQIGESVFEQRFAFTVSPDSNIVQVPALQDGDQISFPDQDSDGGAPDG